MTTSPPTSEGSLHNDGEPQGPSPDGTGDGPPDGHEALGGEPQGDNDEVLESDVLDLTNVPLGQLRVSGDSAVAHALRRLADDLSSSDDVTAGFQSAI